MIESIICLKPPICLLKQSQLQVGEPSFRKYVKFGIGCPKAASNAIGICNMPTQKNPPCTSAELDRHRCLADHKPSLKSTQFNLKSFKRVVCRLAEWLAMIFHMTWSSHQKILWFKSTIQLSICTIDTYLLIR